MGCQSKVISIKYGAMFAKKKCKCAPCAPSPIKSVCLIICKLYLEFFRDYLIFI